MLTIILIIIIGIFILYKIAEYATLLLFTIGVFIYDCMDKINKFWKKENKNVN